MASTYWIKLYYEVLDDPKMGRLPDRIWRRAIELFLMAGEAGDGGYLPPVEDMAWRLRATEDDLLTTLEALRAQDIVDVTQDGGWIVTHFAERQDSASNAERQARYRERKQKVTYYGNDSNENSNEPRNENVTKRNVDIDKDIDKDKDKEKTDFPASYPVDAAVRLYRSVTGFTAIPGNSGDVLPKLEGLLDMFQRREGEAVDYTKPFFETWCKRRNKSGAFYSRTGMGWLDWALANQVPPETNTNKTNGRDRGRKI